MIHDYTKLHELGITHSIEAYLEGERVGGLYGLAMGKMFFGESMFHDVPEASKICLAHLVQISTQYGIELIDCQAHTQLILKKWVRVKFLAVNFRNTLKIYSRIHGPLSHGKNWLILLLLPGLPEN